MAANARNNSNDEYDRKIDEYNRNKRIFELYEMQFERKRIEFKRKRIEFETWKKGENRNERKNSNEEYKRKKEEFEGNRVEFERKKEEFERKKEEFERKTVEFETWMKKHANEEGENNEELQMQIHEERIRQGEKYDAHKKEQERLYHEFVENKDQDQHENELEKSVVPYIIRGHGSEYEYKHIFEEKENQRYAVRDYRAPEEEHTFLLPPNCYVVASMHPGKSEYMRNLSKLYKKVCTMPYDIITHPQEHYGDEIFDAFGAVTIYPPGKPCPNFGYQLITYFKSKFDIIDFGNFGSGVINMKVFRDRLCRIIPEYKTGFIIKENTFENTDRYIIEQFQDSVVPTQQEVIVAIRQFKKDVLPRYIKKINAYTSENELKLVGVIKRYIDEMIKYFEDKFHHIFAITQKNLCERLAINPKKTYIFYNFVCRWVPESERFFELVDEQNVLRNNVNLTDKVFKKLLHSTISNVMQYRRHQIRHAMSRKYPSPQSVKKAKSLTKKTARSAANARSPSPKE